MSAGSADEPNMTPLLDVVLQLVMFFMLCANFVMEQVNETIKLPDAIAAKALDSKQGSFIMVNVDSSGNVLIGRDKPEVLDTKVRVLLHLKQQFQQDLERATREKKVREWEAGKGRSLIILRADRNCSFKQVFDVMQACRQAGYQDVSLRTQVR